MVIFGERWDIFEKGDSKKKRISWFIQWRDKSPWETMPSLTLLFKNPFTKNHVTNLGALVSLLVLILVDNGFCLLSFISSKWGKSSSVFCFIVMYGQQIYYSSPIFLLLPILGKRSESLTAYSPKSTWLQLISKPDLAKWLSVRFWTK